MSDLRIENLRSHVPGLNVQSLDGLNLELGGEEVVIINGPSGSGKSLLLRAIADLDPSTGNVWLDKQSRASMNAHAWRKKVAYLPTDSAWWFETVGEHLLNSDNELLQKLGFEKDVLSWKISRISSGEKQRLALVRCLERSPDVLLLDEPTASLDEPRTLLVEEVVQTYSKTNHAPVLWVSHDARQIKRLTQRVITIKSDGNIEVEQA
ncbi:MAG: ATP-binding cassette domain-containing protein [Gammaproteobacteria bacterium]|nr:ATP-binding cassette domain-containing protein [Gammaproteobacteria bacterium]